MIKKTYWTIEPRTDNRLVTRLLQPDPSADSDYCDPATVHYPTEAACRVAIERVLLEYVEQNQFEPYIGFVSADDFHTARTVVGVAQPFALEYRLTSPEVAIVWKDDNATFICKFEVRVVRKATNRKVVIIDGEEFFKEETEVIASDWYAGEEIMQPRLFVVAVDLYFAE